jgi:hypothetical protein
MDPKNEIFWVNGCEGNWLGLWMLFSGINRLYLIQRVIRRRHFLNKNSSIPVSFKPIGRGLGMDIIEYK